LDDIAELLDKKKWSAARRRITDELLSAPTNHWLWMQLSVTYYEQKNYDKALLCSRRAVELSPDCALALWHYASDLAMSDHEQAALAIWIILLDMDLETIAYGEGGEGMDWALQLINDVHFRMGRLYQHRGQIEPARVSFEKYLHNRGHGVGSIYDAAIARKCLASLTTPGIAS
jgi:tetratricopeptide (TPR) repeat protein